MEKIKSILRPGHEKDDETLYGSGKGQNASSSQPAGTESSAERQERNSSGIAYESTNPGAGKHHEHAYGQAGAQAGAQQLPQSTTGNSQTYTGPAAQQQQHSGFNPTVSASDRYDDTGYGTSTTTQPSTGTPTQGAHGITSWTAGNNNTTGQPTAGGASNGLGSSSGELSHHVHNTVTGTHSTHSHAATNAATGVSTRHHHDQDQSHDHSHGRDAALAGGAAAAGGLAASHTHEARNRHDQSGTEGGLTHHVHNYLYEGPAGSHQHGTHQSGNTTATSALSPPRPGLADASSTASIKSGFVGREPQAQVLTQPGLATGAGANTAAAGTGASGALPSVPNTGGDFMGGQSGTSDRSFPLSGTGTSSTLPDRTAGHGTASHNTAGGNHGREGLAAAAGAATTTAGASQVVDHRHRGSGHQYLGENIDDSPTGGPHATVMANKLDPHLHGSRSIGDTDAIGTGVSSTGATGSDHHHGRDAALAGGLGAGAAGAYAVGRNAGTDTGPAPNTIGPHDKDWKNVLDPRVKPQPELQKSAGPDATGPASNTIGPHDKDWKNVVDPRVQPDPSLQKPASAAGNTGPASNTVGPHDKDWKNVLDPRVKPDPAAQKGDHSAAAATGVAHPTQHQARDAGLVGGGGALAAAGAAYGAGHHSNTAGTAGTAGTTSTSSTAPGTAFSTSGQHATPALGTGTTSSSHEHHGSRDVAAAGGAGAAGLAASRAFHKHDTVVGESGLNSKGANPYSSQGIDPRVDGSHPRHSSGTTGLGSSTTGGSTATDTKHHLGRDTAIAGATLGAGGVGAHELSQHHGERVGHEGLGAHDPATHHGVGGTSSSATHGSSHHGATHSAIPGSSLTSDRARDTYPSPSGHDSKLSHARSDVAHQAHAEHAAGEKKESLGDKIKGMLHIGSSHKEKDREDPHVPTTATEEHSQPHLHHDDRNRLHKEPRHGYPVAGEGTGNTGTYGNTGVTGAGGSYGNTGTTGYTDAAEHTGYTGNSGTSGHAGHTGHTGGTASSEGTTIGTGSGITAATVPASGEGATKTGRELGA